MGKKNANGLGGKSVDILLALKKEIDNNTLAGGSRLPAEQQLCVKYGASRTTIRRALSRLAHEGYVEARQGSGTYVVHRKEPLFSKTISIMFNSEPNSALIGPIQESLSNRGYLLCLYVPYLDKFSPSQERSFLQRVLMQGHQGLLACCSPLAPHNYDVLDEMVKKGMKIIHVEPGQKELPEHNFLFGDYVRAGYLAATKMKLAGYQQVVFCGTNTDWPAARLFLQGFKNGVDDLYNGFDETRNYFDFPTGENYDPVLHKKLVDFVASLPKSTGIVCRSTDFCRVIKDELIKLGKTVPDEFGLIGIHYHTGVQVENDIDYINFDWLDLLKQAVEFVITPEEHHIRQFIPPLYFSKHSIK